MSRKIIRVMGIVTGLLLIVVGILVLANGSAYLPPPQWLYPTVIVFVGIAFFSYGVTGKSRMLEWILRKNI